MRRETGAKVKSEGGKVNFAIKVRAEQVYLLCRTVAKSRHYAVLPQKCGALRASFIKGTMGTEGIMAQSYGLQWVTIGYYEQGDIINKNIGTHRNLLELIGTHNTHLPKPHNRISC